MTMVVLLFFVPILVAILLGLNVLLAVHRPDAEKVSCYECGFSIVPNQNRTPFAIQYYLVGILFLIFDLEIAVLFPLGVTLYQVSNYGFWIATIFLAFLTAGFCYELGKGALKFTDNRSSMAPIRRNTTISKSPSENEPNPNCKPKALSPLSAHRKRILRAQQLASLRRAIGLMSALSLPGVRCYSTDTGVPVGPLFTNNMATTGINPDTGIAFSDKELRLIKLAMLATVEPWFDISHPIPNYPQALAYASLVKDLPLIYIYRLKSDHTVVYIGSSKKGYQRFTKHGICYRSFLKTYGIYKNGKALYQGGCIDFYKSVKINGWDAFEISVLQYTPAIGILDVENLWLALKPTLNRSYYEEGRTELSQETLDLMRSNNLGSKNNFYGKSHSPESILVMRLPRASSSTLYLYDKDYKYIGESHVSLSTAARDIPMSKSTLNKYLNDGKVHNGFSYSNQKPQTNEMGILVLPSSEIFVPKNLQQAQGTGVVGKPIKVKGPILETVIYFVSARSLVAGIKSNIIWKDCTISRPTVILASKKAIDGKFTVKQFDCTFVTEEEYINWYKNASPEHQKISTMKLHVR